MVSGAIPTATPLPEKLPSLWPNSASLMTTLPVTADIVKRMSCTLASPERAQFRDPRQTGKRRTAKRLKTASSLLVINWSRVLSPKAPSKALHLRSPHLRGLPLQLPARPRPALPRAPRKRVMRTKLPEVHSLRSVWLCVSDSWRTAVGSVSSLRLQYNSVSFESL